MNWLLLERSFQQQSSLYSNIIFSAAGLEGWELMPISELSGFSLNGENFPSEQGFARFVFKRPAY
jgi:hypothetical protein